MSFSENFLNISVFLSITVLFQRGYFLKSVVQGKLERANIHWLWKEAYIQEPLKQEFGEVGEGVWIYSVQFTCTGELSEAQVDQISILHVSPYVAALSHR